jgi:ATP-dependent Clp protease ATP-binding subunit ClpA
MDEELELKLNADTRNILQRAEEEVRGMGDEQVSTLHVLLALMQYAKGPWNLLVVRKVTPDAVRAQDRTEWQEGEGRPLPPLQMKVTQALSRVAWNAAISSRERPDGSVTPERLLEALIMEPSCDAVLALRKLEFDLETLKSFLYKFLHSPPKPAQRDRNSDAEDYNDNTIYSRPPINKPFSRRVRLAVERASRAAAEDGVQAYCTGYLLYALAETHGCICSAVLFENGVRAKDVKAMLAEHTPIEATKRDRAIEYANMNGEVTLLLPHVFEIAKGSKSMAVEPEHVLLALLQMNTRAAHVLKQLQIDLEMLLDDLLRTMQNPEG